MGGNNTVRHVMGFHKHTHIRCTHRHMHTYTHMCTHACICVCLYHCHTGVSHWGVTVGCSWHLLGGCPPTGTLLSPTGPRTPHSRPPTPDVRLIRPICQPCVCIYHVFLAAIIYLSFSMHLSVTIYQPIIYLYIINI